MRRREEDAAIVGEHELLHIEIGDAEHQDVLEPLARLRVDRVRSPTAVEAEHLAVHEV